MLGVRDGWVLDLWLRYVVGGGKRFNAWCRHTQARCPVRFAIAGGVLFAVVYIAVIPAPSLFYPVVYGLVWAAMQIFLYRPGGRGQRDYARWCARQEHQNAPPSSGAW
jgi:hypothetical protein